MSIAKDEDTRVFLGERGIRCRLQRMKIQGCRLVGHVTVYAARALALHNPTGRASDCYGNLTLNLGPQLGDLGIKSHDRLARYRTRSKKLSNIECRARVALRATWLKVKKKSVGPELRYAQLGPRLWVRVPSNTANFRFLPALFQYFLLGKPIFLALF